MRVTLQNRDLGTSVKVHVKPGARVVLSTSQVYRIRRTLRGIPNFGGNGPLGEYGEQVPPELPEYAITVKDLGNDIALSFQRHDVPITV
jgi:hypothetical protein